MRAAATTYSERGQLAGTSKKDMNDRAARLIYEKNKVKHVDSSIYTIDLHGLHVKEAIEIALESLSQWSALSNGTSPRVF